LNDEEMTQILNELGSFQNYDEKIL